MSSKILSLVSGYSPISISYVPYSFSKVIHKNSKHNSVKIRAIRRLLSYPDLHIICKYYTVTALVEMKFVYWIPWLNNLLESKVRKEKKRLVPSFTADHHCLIELLTNYLITSSRMSPRIKNNNNNNKTIFVS